MFTFQYICLFAEPWSDSNFFLSKFLVTLIVKPFMNYYTIYYIVPYMKMSEHRSPSEHLINSNDEFWIGGAGGPKKTSAKKG